MNKRYKKIIALLFSILMIVYANIGHADNLGKVQRETGTEASNVESFKIKSFINYYRAVPEVLDSTGTYDDIECSIEKKQSLLGEHKFRLRFPMPTTLGEVDELNLFVVDNEGKEFRMPVDSVFCNALEKTVCAVSGSFKKEDASLYRNIVVKAFDHQGKELMRFKVEIKNLL